MSGRMAAVGGAVRSSMWSRLTGLAIALVVAGAGCRSLPVTPLSGLNAPTEAQAAVPAKAETVPPDQTAEPREVAGVLYEGLDPALTPQELSRIRDRAPLEPGEPLTQEDVRETAELALGSLQEAGYPYAQILVQEARVPPDGVRLTIRAEPGALAFFGQIDIVGNKLVDDIVIRRYLAYRPGERFRVSSVRESHRRLISLGLFEAVDIEVVDADAAPPEVATRVVVKERDPRAIDFSVGYGTEEQLSGAIEWRDLNFLGGARRLSILSRWSWLDRGIEATFVEPYLRRPDLTLAIRGQAWFRDERLFNVLSLGGAATLGHAVGPHDLVSVTYTHQHARSRVTGFALEDPGRRDDLARLGVNSSAPSQEGLLSALRLQLVRDTRDALVDARRGYLGSVAIEQAGGLLPGTFTYREAVLTGQHHHTRGIVTLVQRASYGSIGGAGSPSGVPFFKRYFLGGAENLRGWGRLEVSPLSDTGAPLGGQAYLWATSEVRVPLAGPVGAAVFVDAGNAWRRPWTLRPGDLHYSTGFGVRYRSPFGPLRIDIGYQLTPIEGLRMDGEPQGRRWRVHLGAGQGF